MTAPAIATGVPKPEVPSMIAPNEGDVDDRFLDDLELPGDHGHRVEKHRRDDDPDDAEEPRQTSEHECRYRGDERHPEDQAGDQERGQNAVERGIWRGQAEAPDTAFIAM